MKNTKSHLENLHKENIKQTIKALGIYDNEAQFRCFSENTFTYEVFSGHCHFYEINLTANDAILFSCEPVRNLFNIDNLIYFELRRYFIEYGESINDAKLSDTLHFKLSDYQNENYLNN